MILKTERLNIYPASDREMEDLIQNEPVPELKEAYRQMLDGCREHPEKREWYALWNAELNDGSKTVVGNLSFKGLGEDGILEIGYGMNSGYEGRGLMTEAVSAVVRWAAAQNGVRLIEAETEECNLASKRVLEKAGFVPNGIMGCEGPRYVWRGGCSFRYAVREDTPLILRFIRSLAEYEKMSDEVIADEKTLEEWIFDRKKAEVIFALEDGKEVGFALFFHNFSTFLGRAGIYLEDLYVEPEHRGRGHGKALLKRLAAIAVERGCGRLEWWCLDWNRPSIDFYLSLGAQPMSDWTTYRITGDTLTRLAISS